MRTSVVRCCYGSQRILHRGNRGKAEKNLRKATEFTAEAQRKPKATTARFDETEPAATNSTATAEPTATSKAPASKEKAGGLYKFNSKFHGKSKRKFEGKFRNNGRRGGEALAL